MPPRVVVVGGGLSGLAAAYRMREAIPGCSVTVLEERPRPGGNVGTVVRDDDLDRKATTILRQALQSHLQTCDIAQDRNDDRRLDLAQLSLERTVSTHIRSREVQRKVI